MTDLTDKIIELNKEIKKEIEDYVKKNKKVSFCKCITVTDGERLFEIESIEFSNRYNTIIVNLVDNSFALLDELFTSCYQDIYIEILDCCIKNS